MALAKWYKVDLHTHTPVSNCFDDKSVTAEQWLKAAKSSGINIVAITDHNSVGFINEIDKIKGQFEDNTFKVLYGIELCVSSDFAHILIIFNDKLSVTDIEDAIVSELGLIRSQWGNTEVNVTEDKLECLCNKFKNDIFVIPAHFASNKGLGKSNINAIKRYSRFIDFHAVEVRTEEDLNEYNNKVTKNVIKRAALISGSDNPSAINDAKHSIDGFGKMFTWMKLSVLSFEGMKQVFIDPEYRCINFLELGELGLEFNPNFVTHNYISGFKLNNFKHIDELDLRLSPHLNCIVGGRGSGKSTIVEALNLGLDNCKNLNDSALLKGTTKENSNISIYYNFGETSLYKIDRERLKNNLSFDVVDEHGVVEEAPKFNVDFYGQKEIFKLADDSVERDTKNLIVNMIDKRIAERLFGLKDDIGLNIDELLKYSGLHRQHSKKCDELPVVKGEIKKIEAILNQYKNSGINNLKNKLNKLSYIYERSKDLLEDVMFEYSELDRMLLFYCKEIGELEKELDGNIDSNEVLANVRADAEKARVLALDNKNKIENGLIVLRNTELYKDLERTKVEYARALVDLQGTGSEDIEELQSKIDLLKKREAEIVKVQKEQKSIESHIEKEIDKLVLNLIKLTDERKNALGKISVDSLKFEVFPLKNLDCFKRNLQKEFGKENSFESQFDAICEFVTDETDYFSNYKNYLKFILLTKDGDISKVLGENKITDSRFLNIWKDKFQKGTLNALVNIMPEDFIKIKIVDGINEININEGSPGQKSAAILAFILSNGVDPLIIDQPEDDLDNSLIYNLIVQTVRQMKKSRQIIIVTHNPNIPVLGDAESIIVLERNTESKVVLKGNKKAGCLEERVIRDGICEIMEGGIEAFRKREKKYCYNKK